MTGQPSGRSRSGRFRSPTCRARRRRRRSRIPTKPPAYARNYLKVPDDLIDFTPELRAQALEVLKRYKIAPSPFTPPILGNVNGLLGQRSAAVDGARTGRAAAYDPETHIVYAPAANSASRRDRSSTPPPGFSDIRYVCRASRGDRSVEVCGPGDCCAADSGSRRATNLPRVHAGYKPPAGTPPPQPAGERRRPERAGTADRQAAVRRSAAINLDRGELMWQTPHGDTPDNVRNHPALKGMNIPKTGQPGTSGVGLMVTKTLVVMGDPQVTTPPEHPRGAMLRAYDKQHRTAGRRGLDAGAAERIADDLHGRRQAVHRRGGQRRQLLGRVHRVHAAETNVTIAVCLADLGALPVRKARARSH